MRSRVIITAALLALILSACGYTAPTWDLVGQGEEGFAAVIIEKVWDPWQETRRSDFRLLVQQTDSKEVGVVLATPGQYASLEEGDTVYVRP